MTPPPGSETPSPKKAEATAKDGALNSIPQGSSQGAPIRPVPRQRQDLAQDGWIPIPNTGKILEGLEDNIDVPNRTAALGPRSTYDPGGHADRDVNVEIESPRSPSRKRTGGTSVQAAELTASRQSDSRSRMTDSRVPEETGSLRYLTKGREPPAPRGRAPGRISGRSLGSITGRAATIARCGRPTRRSSSTSMSCISTT